jgi:hypothetical protein
MLYLPGDLDDVFTPQPTPLFDNRRSAFRRKDDLRQAVSIAEVDEHGAAVVAIAVDPTAQRHVLVDMCRAQLAAGMSA